MLSKLSSNNLRITRQVHIYILQEVPIIIVGNKTDLADVGREIYVEDVKDWIEQDYRNIRFFYEVLLIHYI